MKPQKIRNWEEKKKRAHGEKEGDAKVERKKGISNSLSADELHRQIPLQDKARRPG